MAARISVAILGLSRSRLPLLPNCHEATNGSPSASQGPSLWQLCSTLRELTRPIYDLGTQFQEAKEFSGSYALLKAFIQLGLPNALAADEQLQSLLYGEHRLFDNDTLHAAYQKAISSVDVYPDRVLGQPNFQTTKENCVSVSSLKQPYDVAVD